MEGIQDEGEVIKKGESKKKRESKTNSTLIELPTGEPITLIGTHTHTHPQSVRQIEVVMHYQQQQRQFKSKL